MVRSESGRSSEGSGVIRDLAAPENGKMERSPVDRFGACLPGPLKLNDYDDPVTIRARKYATGTHVLVNEIEVETGATPKEVVWQDGKASLYRYWRPDGSGNRHPVPILLTYAFVLKPYILDLTPGNSLVEYLVGAGFDVYMLDFGTLGPEDAGLSLGDLILDYLDAAVRTVLETSGAAEISLLGQSQGGTMCAMYAALFPEGPVRNLALLSAPTEFAPSRPGLLGLWTLASRSGGAFFDPAVVPRFLGNLPTDLASTVIQSASSMQAIALGAAARPFGLGVYDTALRKLRDMSRRDVSFRSWLAASRWVDDAAPFPGEAFREWVADFYQRNGLVNRRIKLRGRLVDLSNIECAVLNVSGKWDYVVPSSQTRATTTLANSLDKTSISLNAGHVGMFVGPGARTGSLPLIRDWLAPRSGRQTG